VAGELGPLEAEEAGDDGVLQQVAVVLRASHVPAAHHRLTYGTTLQRKSDLCIPRKETGRPCSLPHPETLKVAST
jgi:hypothetical protein